MNKYSKLIVSSLLVLMVGIVVGFSTVTNAHATAVGYQYWGAFTVNIGGQSLGIPSGQLEHEINGSGYHINWDEANFASAGNICDPSVRFTYGNGSLHMDGNVHWGCSHVGLWKYALNWNAPRGSACAELWAKNWGVLVTRQCHYVYG